MSECVRRASGTVWMKERRAVVSRLQSFVMTMDQGKTHKGRQCHIMNWTGSGCGAVILKMEQEHDQRREIMMFGSSPNFFDGGQEHDADCCQV